jgi:hypothetical protein
LKKAWREFWNYWRLTHPFIHQHNSV